MKILNLVMGITFISSLALGSDLSGRAPAAPLSPKTQRGETIVVDQKGEPLSPELEQAVLLHAKVEQAELDSQFSDLEY